MNIKMVKYHLFDICLISVSSVTFQPTSDWGQRWARGALGPYGDPLAHLFSTKIHEWGTLYTTKQGKNFEI